MVKAMQEKGNKRAAKSMLRWRMARLLRLRCELQFWRGTLNRLRVERLEAREKQLTRCIQLDVIRQEAREIKRLAPKGWRSV